MNKLAYEYKYEYTVNILLDETFIGQTLFRHDLRTIRDSGDKARHRAAQDASERESAMRSQISKFMQD